MLSSQLRTRKPKALIFFKATQPVSDGARPACWEIKLLPSWGCPILPRHAPSPLCSSRPHLSTASLEISPMAATFVLFPLLSLFWTSITAWHGQLANRFTCISLTSWVRIKVPIKTQTSPPRTSDSLQPRCCPNPNRPKRHFLLPKAWDLPTRCTHQVPLPEKALLWASKTSVFALAWLYNFPQGKLVAFLEERNHLPQRGIHVAETENCLDI